MARGSRSHLGLTQPEAAHILGCGLTTLRQLIANGELTVASPRIHRQLDRDEVEALAAQRWRHHSGPRRGAEETYWVNSVQAAVILGVGRTRVGQLADRGLLPFLTTPNGHRIFRRAQVQVIANARRARWHPNEDDCPPLISTHAADVPDTR